MKSIVIAFVAASVLIGKTQAQVVGSAAIHGSTASLDSTAAIRDSLSWEQQVMAAERWYKNSVIYNLDVHTFQDSDGDGIGDFRGLTARLTYLRSLGVDVIWLAPFQPSPRKDDGYDITDYYTIDSTCGTPGDFQEFLFRAHSMGIRVIMDMVLDHTSDQHPWFRQAAADTNSFRHSWYFWSKERPAAQYKGLAFPGYQKEIWTYNSQAKEYYYHRFYNFQPHLNFLNPQVLAEGQRVLGYWLGQGLDGFRIDAVPFTVEIPDPVEDHGRHALSLINTLRQYVQWHKSDALLLGEANVPPEENSGYFGKTGEGINMLFNFYGNEYLFYGLATGDIHLLRNALAATRDIPPVSQWLWFLRMHDEIDLGRLTDAQRQQVYQRFGPDKDMQLYNRGIRRRLAPMLQDPKLIRLAYSLLFSLPGAPLIRYGEELGMGDDLTLQERLAVRTPMQWSDEKNAGFSSSDHLFRPVITTGKYGYEKVNAEVEERDSGSLLNFIRGLIRLRKSCPEIGLGNWSIPDSSSGQVLVLRYDYMGRSVIVVHNFSDRPAVIRLRLSDGKELGVLDLMTGHEMKKKIGAGNGSNPGSQEVTVDLEGYGFKWFRVTTR